jgi:hypothetical protein
MKPLIQRAAIVAIATIAYISFQNCSKTVHGSSGPQATPQSSTDTELGGTGNGYDGKIFVHIDPTITCTDGNKEKAAIGLPNGEADYYLLRKDCADLNPHQKLAPASVQVVSPTEIVYQSELYVDLTPPPPPNPPLPASENCIGTGVINGMSASITIDINTVRGNSVGRVVVTESTGTTHTASPDVQLIAVMTAGAVRSYTSAGSTLEVTIQDAQNASMADVGAAQARGLAMINSAAVAFTPQPTNFTFNMLSCR